MSVWLKYVGFLLLCAFGGVLLFIVTGSFIGRASFSAVVSALGTVTIVLSVCGVLAASMFGSFGAISLVLHRRTLKHLQEKGWPLAWLPGGMEGIPSNVWKLVPPYKDLAIIPEVSLWRSDNLLRLVVRERVLRCSSEKLYSTSLLWHPLAAVCVAVLGVSLMVGLFARIYWSYSWGPGNGRLIARVFAMFAGALMELIRQYTVRCRMVAWLRRCGKVQARFST